MNLPKLIRVDINLGYLVLVDSDKKYQHSDVEEWIKECMHCGELDDAVEIKEITDVKDVEDYEDNYEFYVSDELGAGSSDYAGHTIRDIIPILKLDTNTLIKILKSRGYTVDYLPTKKKK